MDVLTGVGIRLRLADYKPITSSQIGKAIWDDDLQDCILDHANSGLAEFLPRVRRDDRDHVIMTLKRDDHEVLGRSRQADPGSIPEREIERLNAELIRLRESVRNSPEPEKRKAAEALELPDPVALPEFYRLYGPPWRSRLAIVWGCQPRNHAPAAAPLMLPAAQAVSLLRNRELQRSRGRWGILAAILLVLAILALLLLRHRSEVQRWLPWSYPATERAAQNSGESQSPRVGNPPLQNPAHLPEGSGDRSRSPSGVPPSSPSQNPAEPGGSDNGSRSPGSVPPSSPLQNPADMAEGSGDGSRSPGGVPPSSPSQNPVEPEGSGNGSRLPGSAPPSPLQQIPSDSPANSGGDMPERPGPFPGQAARNNSPVIADLPPPTFLDQSSPGFGAASPPPPLPPNEEMATAVRIRVTSERISAQGVEEITLEASLAPQIPNAGRRAKWRILTPLEGIREKIDGLRATLTLPVRESPYELSFALKGWKQARQFQLSTELSSTVQPHSNSH